MDEKRHGCGGVLRPSVVQVRYRVGDLLFIQAKVDGLVCDSCGEKLIDRDTAVAIEANVMGLPQMVLMIKDRSVVTSQLDSGITINSPGSAASDSIFPPFTVSSEFAGRG